MIGTAPAARALCDPQADRRRPGRSDGAGSLKSSKDREQAAFFIEAIAEDRPDDLAQAYAAALEGDPRWRAHIARSLARMDETRRILEGGVKSGQWRRRYQCRDCSARGPRTAISSVIVPRM
ncbi:MAG: GSU2403 family nucleotidyltransferase fold protein [Beijerinckiaceae bacterium]